MFVDELLFADIKLEKKLRCLLISIISREPFFHYIEVSALKVIIGVVMVLFSNL